MILEIVQGRVLIIPRAYFWGINLEIPFRMSKASHSRLYSDTTPKEVNGTSLGPRCAVRVNKLGMASF